MADENNLVYRLANLLDEAADEIERLKTIIIELGTSLHRVRCGE